MELERVFRYDYAPLNKAFKFNKGDTAIILDVRKPEVAILVNEVSYTISYRDFIVNTKQKRPEEMTGLSTVKPSVKFTKDN